MGRGSSEHVFFVFLHILYTSVSVVALKSLSVLLKTGISTFILLFYRFMTSILTFSEKKSEKTTHPSYNELKSGSALVSILTRDLIKLNILLLSVFPSLSYCSEEK